VREWATELREIWDAAGLTLGQFAILQATDRSAISRYLSGQRVPRGPQFLSKLLAILAFSGKPVTGEVVEHLETLQLRALEVRHPHDYQVRRVEDQLEIALVGKLEAERFARALEGQLAERNREIQELAEDKTRLRAVWEAEHERLTQAVTEISGQLRTAEEWAAQAERRCAQLEEELERLEAQGPAGRDPSRLWYRASNSNGGGAEVSLSGDSTGSVEVLDIRDPSGPVLQFTRTAWKGFTHAVQRGNFDRIG
jgi:transcriptional regulator with XRE-family HTH domain